ncbi:right-handed parallel beta-helix repeat-containing protein [Actinomadura hibisca]|uniref:right-handed parallel beta-helix repeat-containing protein n=1 Tax=Actinomadura hibisca TaxID=68565 RepID=UPI00082F439F|nr:NosD domain-containing protein [Actinomadura hibisca]
MLLKIDLKFAGLLVAGAVATSGTVLLLTGGDDGPSGKTSAGDPFPLTPVSQPPGASGNAGEAGASPTTGAGPGEAPAAPPAPQNLPLPQQAAPVQCPPPTVTVRTPVELQKRLNVAEPGEVIRLAPGVYKGRYRSQRSGAPDKPIFVCGSPKTVLDGTDTGKGYGFHLENAGHWRLVGFTVQRSQKGVMLDGSSGTVIQGLTVREVGDEAVHLRRFSTGNTVQRNRIYNTGRRNPRFGEGIYLGSSHKNWAALTQGQPDKSDNNLVVGNRVQATAEAVDVKEGTTGGRIAGNAFDGSKLSGDKVNDSWVDVKGNGYLIEGNRGARTVADGFQTHREYQGWGTGNTFRGNVMDLRGGRGGFGIALFSDGNTVACDNKVAGGKLLNKGTCS